MSPSHQYLIEMNFAPFAAAPTPQEMVTFTERFVLPTLGALQTLTDSGRIVAGGATLGAVGFSFIASAESPHDLEEMVTSLPLWPRAQTRVVPLGRFEWRAAALRERLQKTKTHMETAAQTPRTGA